MGGSAFSKAINQINIAVSTGNEELKEYANIANMTADEFTKLWELDSAGAMVAFTEGLADFETHGKNTIVLLDELGLTEVRLSDTLRRAAGSGDLMRNTITMANEAWAENADLTREAQTRYATTESQMKLLANSTDQLKIAVGDSLTPAINIAAGELTDANLGITDFVKNNEWLVQSLTVLSTFLGTAVGGISIYTVGIKALAAAKTALAAAAGTAATASGGFMATLLATPLGPVIIALSAVAAAVVGITMAVGAANEAQEEARKMAIDGTNALDAEAEAMEATKQKIIELRDALDSGNISETEAYDTRKQLYQIQTDLIAQYGAEAQGIDLVTGSINNQIAALDKLSKSELQDWNNKNQSAINQAKDLFENDSSFVNSVSSVDLDLAQQLGATLTGGGGQVTGYNFEGTKKEYIKFIEDLMNLTKEKYQDTWETESGAGFYAVKELSAELKYETEELAKYQDIYDKYIENKLTNNKNYSVQYEDIIKKRSALEEAQLSGNTEDIAKTQTELFNALNGAITNAEFDSGIVDYYKKLYPELQSEFDKWNFEIKISVNQNDFNTKVDSALSKLSNLDDIGIIAIGDSGTGTQVQKEGYQQLKTLADEYNVSVESLITHLVEKNRIEGQPVPTGNTKEQIKEITALSAALENLSNRSSLFTTAQKDMDSDGQLSNSTLQKLIESTDDYTKYVTVAGDKVLFNADAFQKYADELNNAEISSRKAAIAQAKLAIAAEKASIATSSDKLKSKTVNSPADYEYVLSLQKANNVSEENIKISEEVIAAHKNEISILEVSKTTYDKYATAIEQTSKATKGIVSEADSLSSAFKEVEENQNLSLKTILSLTEAGYASILVTDEETGAVTLDAEAYTKLAEAQIYEQKVANQTKRSEIIAEIREEAKEVEELLRLYGTAAWGMVGNNNKERQNLLDNLDASDTALDAYLASLDDITAGEYGSGSGGSKTNFSEIWEKRYGNEQYLYEKGELEATAYWEGYKKINDQLLKEYGDSYLKDWRTNDVKSQQGLMISLWDSEFGNEQFLYDKGELDSQVYWEGFKKTNDLLLEQFGNAYLDKWRSNHVKWQNGLMTSQNEAYEKEREKIEGEFRTRILTAREYYDELERLRQQYYGADSQFGNFEDIQKKNGDLVMSNHNSYFEAINREFEDQLKVMEWL
jgi:hypothetical protein